MTNEYITPIFKIQIQILSTISLIISFMEFTNNVKM